MLPPVHAVGIEPRQPLILSPTLLLTILSIYENSNDKIVTFFTCQHISVQKQGGFVLTSFGNHT